MTDDLARLTITDHEVEEVKQNVKKSLEQQIHEAFLAKGYRPVNEQEFDEGTDFETYVAYRKTGKIPTRIVNGYTPSQDENLTNYSPKS